MKATTKFQKLVETLSKELRPITAQTINWAFRKCLEHYAFRLKNGRTTCLDCGHTWEMGKTPSRCQCPQCGARLKVKDTLKQKMEDGSYFTVFTVKDGIQVIRIYRLKAYYHKGKKADLNTREIAQYWINEKGQMALVGLKRTMGCYLDCFIYSQPMALRGDNDVYRYLSTFPTYPQKELLPQIYRNGFTGQYHNLTPPVFFKYILGDNRMETLLKIGHIEHFKYFASTPLMLNTCWASYKVAMRNGYEFKDWTMWCDYVKMLKCLQKDYRNPKIICPANLNEEHDKLMKKYDAYLEREREKQRLHEIALQEARDQKKQMQLEKDKADYIRKMSKFFNLTITDGTLVIKALQSVDDFAEEGKAMHHCVYSNEYYKREGALILSARIDEKRIETIEVSLVTMQVLQSRGVCNQNTPYHDRILQLMNDNMGEIRKCLMAS